MANTLLTPDMITKDALMVLHQKLNFVGNVVREYDSSFAQEGAKIGNTVRIRRPLQYAVGTGATIATGTGADSVEQSFTLTVNTQKHVPMRFNSNELSMKVNDFRARHIEPAMAVLAAKIEADALSMVSDVYNNVQCGTAVAFAEIMAGRKQLVDNLAPNANRTALLDTQANVDLVDALKGLYNDPKSISKMYKEGMMGHASSFDFYENTLLANHTNGAAGGTTNYDIAGASQVSTDADTMSLNIDTGTAVITAGQVFTIAGVNSVHPESKTSTGIPQQFVALTGGTGTTTLTVSPGIVISGPRQNVSAAPANNATITFAGAASTTYYQSCLFQQEAFAFATADLVLPNGLDMASRQNFDGISLRLIRDYDVIKDRLYTRMDVLYGYRTLYRQLACRLMHT